jgi:Beta-lactamase
MSFLRSPARRSVLRVTGVVVAVGLATAGSSAYAFAAGAGSGQKASGKKASGQAVSSQPPTGLQQAADQLVADGVPGVIIMTRRGQQVSNVVAGLADKATGQPMQPQDKVRIGSITKTFVATVVLQLRLHQPGREPPSRHRLQRLQEERATAGRHRDGRLPARRQAGHRNRTLREGITPNQNLGRDQG